MQPAAINAVCRYQCSAAASRAVPAGPHLDGVLDLRQPRLLRGPPRLLPRRQPLQGGQLGGRCVAVALQLPAGLLQPGLRVEFGIGRLQPRRAGHVQMASW